ncbi:MAG TPA: S8 family serine peptidase [Steroidobacteraceae bacterium]|jgi:hypothetical protein
MSGRHIRSGAVLALVTAAILLIGADPQGAQALDTALAAVPRLQVYGAAPQSTPAENAAFARLDGTLAQIAHHYADRSADHSLAGLRALNPAARLRLVAPRTAPEVLIDAVTDADPHALRSQLGELGLRDPAMFANDVGGWLPVDQLGRAARLASLRFARASMPHRRAGPVATQGDFAQGSAAIRTSFPRLTGAGITVGVLSDSFNCYATYATSGVPRSGYSGYALNGFTATYADDQNSGALPAGVAVLKEASCLNYGAPELPPFGDEGRSILQIVHAIAPAAGLAFYTAENSEADFASGIGQLAAAGAKIIDDDVGYFDEPFFQDGIVAQAIDQVAATGVAYFSSAGNDGRFSYENTAPAFPVTAGSGPNAGEQLLNFDSSGASTSTMLPITIPALYPGEFVALVVEWDQPYLTGAASSGGATSAIDLCVLGSVGIDQINFQAAGGSSTCTGPNATGVDPVQILVVGNPASASGYSGVVNLNVQIGLASGSMPGRIKFVLEGNGAAVSINSFDTQSATLQGHPGAAGATAVGAAFYLQTPRCGTTPATLESYSSAGGAPILFSAAGVRLSMPSVRQKPELVGPDGVNDTFLGFIEHVTSTIAGCVDNAALPDFFGTSAAAPHVAAAAALMMQANPAWSPAQIVTALELGAAPMASSVNFDSGYGFVQADAALAQLPPPPPSLSLSPAAITLGASATLSWSSVSTSGCSASGSWSGDKATSGSQSVTPTASGTASYALSCTGPAGSNSASIRLTVNPASAGGSGGGGGAFDVASLLMLCVGLLWARRAPIGRQS